MKKDQMLENMDGPARVDKNSDGIDDRIAPPPVDIGAGVQELEERFRKNPNVNPVLSGGDVDARWEDAEGSGDETVGGSTATPEQNVVDDLGAALGVTYADDEPLKPGEKELERDRHRWELDPASSEDYEDRSKEK